MTEEVLRSVFGKEGEIKDCKVVRESSTRSKGYGFVTFTDVATVNKILNRAPGFYTYKGRPWNVSQATRRHPIQQRIILLMFWIEKFLFQRFHQWFCIHIHHLLEACVQI